MIVSHIRFLVAAQVDAPVLDGEEAVVHEAHIGTARTGIPSFSPVPVKKASFQANMGSLLETYYPPFELYVVESQVLNVAHQKGALRVAKTQVGDKRLLEIPVSPWPDEIVFCVITIEDRSVHPVPDEVDPGSQANCLCDVITYGSSSSCNTRLC